MEFKCDFEIQKWLFSPKDHYVCEVTEASTTKPNTKVVAVHGNHLPNKTNLDVTAISFDNKVVEYLPKGLEKIFPSLIAMQVHNCGLKSISQRDFIGLENFEAIFFTNNKLKSLPSNLFSNTKKLRTIYFGNNQLEHISSDLFSPLITSNIKSVDFTGNSRINVCFGDNTISPVATIDELMRIIDEKCLKPIDDEKPFKKESFVDAFSKGSADLWTTGRFSDFIIIAGEKKFRVHKIVLAIQSVTFSELFDNNESLSELNVEGIDARTIEEFLRYLYTGELEQATNMIELFKMAAKWEIQSLKSYCEDKLIYDLSSTNAYDIFTLGYAYNSNDMKTCAFAEIKNMFPGVDLDETLVNKPEELKDIIDTKKKLDSMLSKLNKTTLS